MAPGRDSCGTAELLDGLRGLRWAAAARDAACGGGQFALGGLVGSSSAALLAALDDVLPRPRLVVAPGPEEAAAFREDLVYFLGAASRVALFPAFDATRADARARERGRLGERTDIAEGLASGSGPDWVVAPLSAVLQPVPGPDVLAAASVRLRSGETIDTDELSGRLARAGFERVPMVEAPGEWAQRGGIIDIFPRGRDAPVRAELFGDEIESLRVFDALTQRSIETIDACAIPLLSVEQAAGVPATAEREERVRALKRAKLLPDLLPGKALIVHLEEAEASAWLARFERSRPEEELGTMYARFSLRALDFPALRLSRAPIVENDTQTNARLLTATGLAKDLITFRDAVDALLARNNDVRLLCATAGEVARVKTLLAEGGLDAKDSLRVEEGRLAHGFQVPELGLALLSYDELFGRTRLPRPSGKQRVSAPAPQWTDLRIDDPIVHLDHGIGIYKGLVKREQQGVETEHLTLEFAKGTRVYVPVTKASLVHRYVGASESDPKLSTIGGKEWNKRKNAVTESVEGIAIELLETHARRAARPGIPFPPDTPEQLEFDATFPFDLTPDQERALPAIKADMERDTPMDRLLCGDVGFGKTELAVRAAFKCVMAGKQVAVLVPTTVLAEQHGHVFRERFASYPINVSVLCRFRTGKEQRTIVADAAAGRTDVVIGTHRLVSPDVTFRDLGLVVIDEEQRFGVRAKEALRHVRATVDVITLSATPIPRTLHMALLGLRDISSLTTPPLGRRPIETRVIAPDDALVRDALLSELERGGQAFFIHNRVKSIEKLASKLRHLVPEARVGVVHGQMSDHMIEERMLEFVEHRTDVLVATTIVESGLDIPNANTMFIDRADWLGLADLHQLRGRVGRYDRRAYCFLIVPAGTLATDAEHRVRAIEELSDLGAGFRIAMRDMEIRGAGSLLGAEQSGHIASVGYELYCQLLADAVKRVKKERVAFRTASHVSLPVPTAIPAEYVPDDRQRIDTYRRFSAAHTVDEVHALLAECTDRFGSPPAAVRLLARLARVRLLGEVLGITRMAQIDHDGEQRILLRCVEPMRVKRKLEALGDRVRVVDKAHCHLLLPRGDLTPFQLVDAVLTALAGEAPKPKPAGARSGGGAGRSRGGRSTRRRRPPGRDRRPGGNR